MEFFFLIIGNVFDLTDSRQEDVGSTIFWNGLILFGYPWNLWQENILKYTTAGVIKKLFCQSNLNKVKKKVSCMINKKHTLSAKKGVYYKVDKTSDKRWYDIETTSKQRLNNVETTLKQRRQRWNNVHPTFKSNLISTLIQRWKLMLNQRWFNVVVLAGLHFVFYVRFRLASSIKQMYDYPSLYIHE